MSSTQTKNWVGEVIADRYRILQPLGTGTMGTVYRAEHVHMKKAVAVKILHTSHVRDPEVLERFQREAQAAANIDHPNICTATDFGSEDDETYFMVMEYLDGRSLHDVINAGETFSPQRAVRLAIQMCSALERAHELGVVHRDLKPENILLIEKDGVPDFVKITDFGVAQVRLFKDATRLTQAGVVYGSPLYMSPEQAAGREVDHRADLYSVGIMLYELLTGKLPFYAKTLTVVLNMHIQDQPKPFREVTSETIPTDLEELVMGLLSKNRDDRPQSARELRERLELLEARFVVDDHVAAPPAPPTPRPQPFKVVLVGLTVVLAGILAIAAARGLMETSAREASDATQKTGPIAPRLDPEVTARARAAYLKNADVARALSIFETAPEEGLETLKGVARKDPENAHIHFILGHALLESNAWSDGYGAFQKAITLDPTYAHDRELLDDVMKHFEASDGEEHVAADTFIRETLKRAAAARLGALAEFHKVRKVRRRALKTLEESGLLADIDEWNQLTISLRHAVGCEANQEFVVRIGELGDPRALAALQRFSAKPKDGCDGQDCWSCLRDDLRVAIDKLKAAQAGPSVGTH